MKVALKIFSRLLHVAVVVAGVRGLLAPYTANLTLFFAVIQVIAGLGFMADRKPTRPTNPVPHWIWLIGSWLPMFVLAAHGWFWCAASYGFAAIAALEWSDRLEKRGAA